MNRPVILIVDDEDHLRSGLKTMLTREKYEVLDTGSFQEAVKIAEEKPIDLAILDVRLGSFSGLVLLDRLRDKQSDLPIIMITGYGTVETAVEAMKKGADDFVLKPIENHLLRTSVAKCLELSRLRGENRFLKEEIRESGEITVVTNDPGVKKLLLTADRVKDASPNILISGESGVGKEVMARHIHYTGPRKDSAFISVNCAALSETLLLSELFGHEKGAFTDAGEKRAGKFEMADGGTLFLDEIGDMSLSAQAKLLRVVEDRCFERLGGSRSISVDIQLIAATNRNLQNLVSKGEFRQDLYYRLNVITLDLPPLRHRLGDILLLAEYFIRKYSKRYHKKLIGLDPKAEKYLESHEWPGNIRELSNVINRGVLLCRGDMLEIEDLVLTAGDQISTDVVKAGESGSLEERLHPVLSYWESRILADTLKRYAGNKTRAAEELGITRKTLHSKLVRLGEPGN